MLNPYLIYDGRCEEAFRFYARVLGGEIEMLMTNDEAPPEMDLPAEWKKKIMHARMLIEGEVLMASDAPPGHYQKPQGFSVSLQVDDPDRAEKLFHALAEGGEVRMAIAQTFWARRFGMCTDRFGIPWMINCE